MKNAQRKSLTLAIAAAAIAAAPHPGLSQTWSSGSSGAIYYSGGNVGVGVTSPWGQLTVNAPAAAPSLIHGAAATADWAWTNGVDLALTMNSAAPYTVSLQTRHTEADGYVYPLALNPLGGNVGIGVANPVHLLQVAGTIGAQEVLVTSTGADYVFDPGYRLLPLTEVAAYIEANHHLPDVPSADEVKQKGMDVGEMEAKLLAKVEELTLHMIQQEKENRELRDRIAKLEKPATEPVTAK